MGVVENVSLASLTTLKLGGPARRVTDPDRDQDVIEAVRAIDARGEPLLVLGGGSNLVVGDEGFDGTVLHMVTRGVCVASPSGRHAARHGCGRRAVG